jgi:uncharacterized protein (DUF2141 family)
MGTGIRMMVICMMAASAQIDLSAATGFRVAGTITFPKKGNIFLQLVDRDRFDEEASYTTENTRFNRVISIGPAEIRAGKVSFSFENAPAGRYAIRAFQDVNGNGSLDSGALGPSEPWGFYKPSRPLFRGPRFEEVAFTISADIANADFELK